MRRVLEDFGFEAGDATGGPCWHEGPALNPNASPVEWISGFLDALQDLPILVSLPPHFAAWDDTLSARKRVMLMFTRLWQVPRLLLDHLRNQHRFFVGCGMSE